MYDEIDLLDAAGGAVAKRAIPALAGLIVLTLVIRRLRSGRNRRRTAKRAAVSAPSSTDEARSAGRLQ